MKKALFFAFMLLSCGVFAQQNQIVEPWKLWSNLHTYCHSDGTEYATDYIRFEGDTLVNGIYYKKVWQSEDENHNNWIFYGYFIREENEKVYLKPMFEGENLLYDFSLQGVGDTVTIFNPLTTSPLHLTLTEIDSVETTNGWRTRWKLMADGYENPEYWIKGIGSMSGVLNSGTAVFGGLCGSATLLCEHEHDTLIYQNPNYGSCYIITTGLQKKKEGDAFTAHYNRQSKTLSLHFVDASRRDLLIDDFQGRILLKKKIETQNFVTPISVSSQLIVITVFKQNRSKTVKLFVL